MDIVLITGGFDPVHSGHIEYVNEARNLGDMLIIGVNSDEWLTRKKGKPFMPYLERARIMESIKGVDEVISFDDSDNSASDAIRKVRDMYPDDTIIFANGGDRTSENIPEMSCGVDNVEFLFSVGGSDKRNSSSWILESWKSVPPITVRPWGFYVVLHTEQRAQLKRIHVEAGSRLSKQSHKQRAEHWYITKGYAKVELGDQVLHLGPGDYVSIGVGEVHRVEAEGETDLVFFEVQTGEYLGEDDIIRYEDDFGRS